MPMGLLFWFLMLIWLIFGVWRDWPNYPLAGHNFLLFVVIGLLGWHTFGAPIR
jgi:ABC-type polysaccharide/polyol phosphate export permease